MITIIIIAVCVLAFLWTLYQINVLFVNAQQNMWREYIANERSLLNRIQTGSAERTKLLDEPPAPPTEPGILTANIGPIDGAKFKRSAEPGGVK